jgi:hypothetical protein
MHPKGTSFRAYDTQSFNRYSYVKNNPLNYTDPSGHWSLSSIWKKAGHWLKKNWRKVAGAALMVVGVIGLTVGLPFGGIYWGPAALTLGASLIEYDPDEKDSPSNQVSVGVGMNGMQGIPVLSWGGDDSGREEEQQRIDVLVHNASLGTHSAIDNKVYTGANTSSYQFTAGNAIVIGVSQNNSSVNNILGVDGVETIVSSRNPFTRIATGLGNSLSTVWNRKNDISNNIVRGFQGLGSGIPKMWDNSPWYARGLLFHSSAIFTVPAMEKGAWWLMMNPAATPKMLDILEGSLPGIPPASKYGYGTAIGMGIVEYADE